MHNEAARLREQARAFRRVAEGHHDPRVQLQYEALAKQHEELADVIREAQLQQALGNIH